MTCLKLDHWIKYGHQMQNFTIKGNCARLLVLQIALFDMPEKTVFANIKIFLYYQFMCPAFSARPNTPIVLEALTLHPTEMYYSKCLLFRISYDIQGLYVNALWILVLLWYCKCMFECLCMCVWVFSDLSVPLTVCCSCRLLKAHLWLRLSTRQAESFSCCIFSGNMFPQNSLYHLL